jgi:hypothetical protein
MEMSWFIKESSGPSNNRGFVLYIAIGLAIVACLVFAFPSSEQRNTGSTQQQSGLPNERAQ